MKENDVAAKICGPRSHAPQTCCHIKTGGSVTAYRIRVRKERCSAYFSFPNLDPSLPVSMWRPGVELEWELPEEPSCRVNEDCLDLENSVCSPNPMIGGSRKCMCKRGYEWYSVNGICQSTTLFAIATLTTAMITTLVLYLRRQRIKGETEQSLSRARDILNANNSGGRSAKIFTMKELTKATSNFSKANLLGFGGFGEVFKGTLDDGTITAIKRAKPGNIRGIDQILNEVKILCQVNHRSLVRLLGCCVELPEPLLVYEYVPNGTLFEHLHHHHHNNNSSKGIRLGWHSRLRIAHQTAEGIAYLHNAAVPRIYHRDIKSSNILLDDNLDAKVSDFGLSRLVVSDATHITTCAKGTLGYLDPEYYVNFQLTDKSDVYSFGVVLLELLTSKKAIDFNREEEDVNLVVLIKRALREGRLMDNVDPMLKSGDSRLELESMKAFGALAIACLDDRRKNRPTMKDIADEIECIIGILVGAKVDGLEV